MIKNLKNWLSKPPGGHKDRRGENKENGGERRSNLHRNRVDRLFPPPPPRRVNFRNNNSGNTNYELDLESEDGGSEVTLTTIANEPAQTTGRHHHTHYNYSRPQQPVNPYSVMTEPRRTKGPRSCPGGAGAQLLDIDEELSGSGGASGAQYAAEDYSPLDTRSEFAPAQRVPHRRSARALQQRRSALQAQPLRDIGNCSGRAATTVGGYARRMPSIDDIRPTRYKNVAAVADREDELAEECDALRRAYQMERARRKELQRRLKLEAEANERLKLQIETLLFNFGLLARQQQQFGQQTLVPNFVGSAIPFDQLMGGSMFGQMGGSQHSWTGSTPSSSMRTPQQPQHHQQSVARPAPMWPTGASMFPPSMAQQNAGGAGGGAAGETLASLLSAASVLQHNQLQQHQQQQLQGHPPAIPPRDNNNSHNITDEVVPQQQNDGDDEVVVYRGKGHHQHHNQLQHNTDSFSGSSRPTTGELREMEQIKADLVKEANFSLTSPESARMMARSGHRNRHNASYALGLSLSADTIGTVLVDDDEEMTTPQAARDDGYMTSEANLSSSNGIVIDGHGTLQRSQSVG